jgi:hypothetical protein
LVWKVFGPSAEDAGHFFETAWEGLAWQAGIGDLDPICNAQICGRCDARASIGSGSADLIKAEDFRLDIHRGAVHIFGREQTK